MTVFLLTRAVEPECFTLRGYKIVRLLVNRTEQLIFCLGRLEPLKQLINAAQIFQRHVGSPYPPSFLAVAGVAPEVRRFLSVDSDLPGVCDAEGLSFSRRHLRHDKDYLVVPEAEVGRHCTYVVRYLAAIRPSGGTNIHDALVEALRPEPRRGMLPMVLFLTDGLPTVGRTGERTIRDMVERGNAHHRRIFTFGVGEDVNAPLLDRLAELTRGTSTYVLPGEDVELKVAGVFKRLSGPVLADVTLTARDATGRTAMIPVEDVIPATMPDLFEDDQLIVLGRYRWDGPITFRIAGNYLGRKRTFEFTFDMQGAATTRNAFVPRLWASRRIGELIDQIRQIGAPGSGPGSGTFDPFHDPRTRELAEAVLQLSTEWGILTEYTAFLATEGTDLSDWDNMRRVAGGNLRSRAIGSVR